MLEIIAEESTANSKFSAAFTFFVIESE